MADKFKSSFVCVKDTDLRGAEIGKSQNGNYCLVTKAGETIWASKAAAKKLASKKAKAADFVVRTYCDNTTKTNFDRVGLSGIEFLDITLL